MAKKTLAKRDFYVVDLIRNKGVKHLDIPKTRVDITIEIETRSTFKKPDPAPKAAFDRLEKVGREELDRYESIITEEAQRLDAKIDKLMEQPTAKNLEAAEKMIQATNVSIKNALASAEGAANGKIEAALKKEAQRDKLLKEARVKTVFKFTMGLIKIAGSTAKLVATTGADVTSYKTIAQQLYVLGKEVQQQLKNEKKLRADLQKGVLTMLQERGTAIDQAIRRQGITDTSGIDPKKPKEALVAIQKKIKAAGEEITQGKSAGEVMTNVIKYIQAKVKSKLADVEKARKAYREHNTKTRHKTDSVSAKADKLAAVMKKAKNLKEGVRLGAQVMSIRRQATAYAKKLEEREKFLDEMQAIMKSGGLEIDDRTTIQKLQAIDTSTILSEGKGLFDAIKDVKEMVENVADAVT